MFYFDDHNSLKRSVVLQKVPHAGCVWLPLHGAIWPVSLSCEMHLNPPDPLSSAGGIASLISVRVAIRGGHFCAWDHVKPPPSVSVISTWPARPWAVYYSLLQRETPSSASDVHVHTASLGQVRVRIQVCCVQGCADPGVRLCFWSF